MDGSGTAGRLRELADRHAGLLLALPGLSLMALFVVFPFMLAVYTGFTDASLGTLLRPAGPRFTGLDNYRHLLGDPGFRQAFRTTLYFAAVTVPAQVALALAFAVAVNGSALWKKILRISFFLPVITSMAVLSVVWTMLYNPSLGPVNAFLNLFGFPAQPLLAGPGQAMNCIIIMSVWQGTGFQMMIFLAGMQTIPPELYEAAAVENAGRWQRFRYITLPLLKNTAVFAVFITTVFAFKLFVQPHLITGGGPQGSTSTLILHLYDAAFVNGSYGRACAAAVLFFLLVLGVSLVQRRILPREEKW